MHLLRSVPLLRASLALSVLAACPFPVDIGDSPQDSETAAATASDSDSATTTTGPSATTTATGDEPDPTTTGPEPTTATTTVPPDEPTTSTVTGDVETTATVTGEDTSSSGATTSDRPDGLCFDRNHGEYWCECSESETEACEDGVRVCLTVSFVIDEHKFSPCLVCGPGDELDCDVRGQPGKQFCDIDAQDLWIDDFDMPPVSAFGVCIPVADVVCQPGAIEKCDGGFSECLVDEQGVPFVGPCE